MKTKKYLKRKTWLAARPHSVGASETAALFNQSYSNHNVQTVYASKVTPPDPDAEDDLDPEAIEHLTLGNCLQDGIVEAAKKRDECKGLDIVPNRVGEEGCLVYHHDERDYISFTPDAMIYPRTPVEVKNIGQWNAGEWDEGDTPLMYQIQLQHQIYVAGADHGYLIACLGGQKLQIRKMPRNDNFLKKMVERIDRFWDMVQKKTPPPIDGSEASKQALASLYPKSDNYAVEMPSQAIEWLNVREVAKRAGKYCEEMAKEAENRMKACLQEAVAGILPDGRVIKWGYQKTKAKHCPHCKSQLKAEGGFRKFMTVKKLPKGLELCPCSTDLAQMTGGQALEFNIVDVVDAMDDNE